MNVAQTPTKFTERVVEAGGERICVREAGTGEPLLVLSDEPDGVPGLAEAILSASRRVVVVALPMGGSRSVSVTLDKVIASLGFEQVALLASSVTTPAALWLAINFRERIQSIVLESPIAFSPHVPLLVGRTAEELQGCFNVHPERKLTVAASDVAALVARARARIAPAQDEIFAAELAAIGAPVLTLLGTRDPLVPVECGRTYKQLIPNCWLLMVYDAAHDIRGDRPEAFAEVVDDFLRRGAHFAVGERSSRLNR